MQETYLISDTHFYHKRVLQFEDRPFETIEDMNETLIANWNKIIKPEYLVFHLGDVALTGFDNAQSIISRLNGYKFLIKGNHDSHSSRYYKDMGFDEVSAYPIIFRDKYVLSHAPQWGLIDTQYFNIHGHLHSHGSKYDDRNFYNVCVERNDYKPVNFKYIEKYFNQGG